MSELKQGSLVIVNDTLGFVVQYDDFSLILNTEVGRRRLKKPDAVTILAQPEELVAVTISNLRKVVRS